MKTIKLPDAVYASVAEVLYTRANVASARAYTPRANTAPATLERFKAEAKAAHALYMAFTATANVSTSDPYEGRPTAGTLDEIAGRALELPNNPR